MTKWQREKEKRQKNIKPYKHKTLSTLLLAHWVVQENHNMVPSIPALECEHQEIINEEPITATIIQTKELKEEEEEEEIFIQQKQQTHRNPTQCDKHHSQDSIRLAVFFYDYAMDGNVTQVMH